jgi:hypothetical protein
LKTKVSNPRFNKNFYLRFNKSILDKHFKQNKYIVHLRKYVRLLKDNQITNLINAKDIVANQFGKKLKKYNKRLSKVVNLSKYLQNSYTLLPKLRMRFNKDENKLFLNSGFTKTGYKYNIDKIDKKFTYVSQMKNKRKLIKLLTSLGYDHLFNMNIVKKQHYKFYGMLKMLQRLARGKITKLKKMI